MTSMFPRHAARSATIMIVAALLVTATTARAQTSAGGLTAEQILRRAEQSVYPDAFHMVMTLETLQNGATDSSLELDVQYKKDVGSRIEMLSPARSRGIRFLQKDATLWMYNPRAGSSQAIRLSPRASFQGSVFSNRDIGDPQYSNEYTIRLVDVETIDHPDAGTTEALALEGTARDEQVAYSKIRIWVDPHTYTMLRAEYYAKSGLLFKTMIFSKPRDFGGVSRPSVLVMTSEDEPGKQSIMTITELDADPNLPDATFSLASLVR